MNNDEIAKLKKARAELSYANGVTLGQVSRVKAILSELISSALDTPLSETTVSGWIKEIARIGESLEGCRKRGKFLVDYGTDHIIDEIKSLQDTIKPPPETEEIEVTVWKWAGKHPLPIHCKLLIETEPVESEKHLWIKCTGVDIRTKPVKVLHREEIGTMGMSARKSIKIIAEWETEE